LGGDGTADLNSDPLNGYGFRFDFLNDALGMLLIVIGVQKLSRFRAETEPRYPKIILFVRTIAIFELINAIQEHWITPRSSFVDFTLMILALLSLTAIICFCVAMRWLCIAALLEQAAQSWKTTTTLFLWIYVFPLGLIYSADALSFVTEEKLHIDLGPWGFALLMLFVVPLIHFFMSTSRMKLAIETASSVMIAPP
jgi:hypothetical protein